MRLPRRAISLALATILGGTVIARLFGYQLGVNTLVRCRDGHLFTTIWLPGVNLKALDLVIVRFQHCPVGKHWAMVRPVRRSDLSDEERRFALAHHDVRIP